MHPQEFSTGASQLWKARFSVKQGNGMIPSDFWSEAFCRRQSRDVRGTQPAECTCDKQQTIHSRVTNYSQPNQSSGC